MVKKIIQLKFEFNLTTRTISRSSDVVKELDYSVIILPNWKDIDEEINARGSRKNIKFMYAKGVYNNETN